MTDPLAPTIGNIAVHSVLNDGTRVLLRCIRPSDEARLREGIARLSAESRYMRFFSPTPMPPDEVVERLVDVDGHDHIGWGALCLDDPGHPAIGAVHAVRHADGGRVGEYSIAILDAYQGRGLARMLTAALLVQCLAEELTMLDIHILSENEAARRLIKSLRAEWRSESAGVAEYGLDVSSGLLALREDADAPGVEDVFRTLVGEGWREAA